MPYFAGEFCGNGHSVTGLSLTRAGSRQGLFRVAAEDALITDLRVYGSIAPDGSAQYVGGIAGFCLGSIRNCRFEGTVRGLEHVGGIAGFCGETAVLFGCEANGEVTGEHFVGGIAGDSAGSIAACRSSALVNTEAVVPEKSRSFDLSGFDISSLSVEDYLDITDLGGICGRNTGILSECVNTGNVGAHYTGYNVGGIAGLTTGYITGCENSGTIRGRKDVGGIAGQLVPYTEFDLTESKFDDIAAAVRGVNGSIASAADLVGEKTGTVADALAQTSGHTDTLLAGLRSLFEQINARQDEIKNSIMFDPETGELHFTGVEGIDTSALASAIAGLSGRYEALLALANDSSGELMTRLLGVTSSLSALMGRLNEAVQNANLEMETFDLSADEAYEHDRGAVDGCINRGDVTAESCAGGITGSIAYELDFDKGDVTGLAEAAVSEVKEYIFAVVRACESYGRIEAKNDFAGGITGEGELGAVHDCVGAGYIVSVNGGYIGGIAGRMAGTVQGCSARPVLSGGHYTGGIAGEAENIRGSCVLASFESFGEYAGAVAGWVTGELNDNSYVRCRPAGVDGISYTGKTNAISYEELLEREDLPGVFREITVRFIGPGDELLQTVTTEFGGSITEFPAVAMDGARRWRWDDADLRDIRHSMDVRGAYYNPVLTLSTGGDIPEFLVEGSFYEGQELSVTDSETDSGETRAVLRTISVSDYTGTITVRMLSEERGRLFVCAPDGTRRELPYTTDGRYKVFTVENGASVQLQETPARTIAAGTIAAAALFIVLRRKKKNAPTSDAEADGHEPDEVSGEGH